MLVHHDLAKQCNGTVSLSMAAQSCLLPAGKGEQTRCLLACMV